MLVVARWGSATDFGHMFHPVSAVVEGRWADVYPASTAGTSPSGWLLVAAPPAWLFTRFAGVESAYAAACLLVLPALLFALRFALRALWPTLPAPAAWGLAAVGVWLPTSLATYMNAYHPQDLAAVALVAVGLGLVARRQWWWAGGVLGLAVMTRQWAVLVLVVAAGFSGRAWWRVAAAAAVVGVVLTAPLLVVVGGNDGWVTAFSSSSVGSGVDTLWGRFTYRPPDAGGPSEVLQAAARLLPVLGAAGLGLVAWRRRLAASELLVMFALSALGLRMVFETANYLYYWAPFAALFVLLVPYRRAAWWAVAGYALVPWLLDSVFPPIGTIGGGVAVTITEAERLVRVVVAFTLAAGVPLVCWLLHRPPPDTSLPAPAAQASSTDPPAPTASSAAGGGEGEVGRPARAAAWVVATAVAVGVVAPFAAGWSVPEPVGRVRALAESQERSRERLERDGVDIGRGGDAPPPASRPLPPPASPPATAPG
jgi:hypothetical protein